MSTKNTLDKFKDLLRSQFDTLEIKEERPYRTYTFPIIHVSIRYAYTDVPNSKYEWFLNDTPISEGVGKELIGWIVQEKEIRKQRVEEEKTFAVLHAILNKYK